MGGWHTCNIIRLNGTTKLWQFSASGKGVELEEEITALPSESVPPRYFLKSWGSIINKKLNVGWLPPQEVFLRVIQLPKADFNETLSMVEFQLEKLSPMPVTQIRWAIQVLPGAAENEQTVIVAIAPDDLVENQLAKLESIGFYADRLETPLMDVIFAHESKGDSVWVYPAGDAENTMFLTAWWIGGTLRHLGIVNLPQAENNQQNLKSQLLHIIWSGELEGWYSGNPRWHLVLNEQITQVFEPVVNEISDGNYEKHPPLEEKNIAELTAKRLLNLEGKSTLVPPEYLDKYKQSFIDRLWMSGVAAGIMVYLLGVLVYFGFLQVLEMKYNKIQSQLKEVSLAYTNTLALKAQVQVLQDQLNLKNAVLEAYYAVVMNLPEELTLNSLSFSRGKTVTIFGTAPADQNAKVTEYNGILGRLENNGQKVFSKVNPPTISLRGDKITWSFSCELNRAEFE
jgi:hypothetical protein